MYDIRTIIVRKLIGEPMDVQEKIRQILIDFWGEQALEVLPDGDISIDGLTPPLDSLAAVEVLVELDKLLGKKLPKSVIKPGGYESEEDFLAHLTEKVMQAFGDQDE